MAARKAPAKPVYTLTHPEGHGTGIGSMDPGTEVTVDLIHTEPVPGVGGNEGYLFSWVTDVGQRSAHLPQADFERLFTKVGK